MPDCQVCQDAGWVADRSEGPGRTRAVPCPAPVCPARQAHAQAHIDALFRGAAIPPIFQGASLEDFAQAKGVLTKLAEARLAGDGLFILGPRGVGKTHLAVAILKARLGQGRTGLFVEVANLLDAIRATYQKGAETSEQQLLEAVMRADCLVLDDLGVETDTDWVRTKLFQVVDARWSHKLETLCTTNLTPDELGAEHRLGQRTVSRLVAMCRALPLKGPDRRGWAGDR